LTRLDVLALVAILAIVIVVAGSCPVALSKNKMKVQRAQCQNNLKQLGLGFRTGSDMKSGLSSGSTSTNSAGTVAWPGNSNIFQPWAAMFGQINDPRILVCPSDDRMPARSLATVANSNLSYYLGL